MSSSSSDKETSHLQENFLSRFTITSGPSLGKFGEGQLPHLLPPRGDATVGWNGNNSDENEMKKWSRSITCITLGQFLFTLRLRTSSHIFPVLSQCQFLISLFFDLKVSSRPSSYNQWPFSATLQLVQSMSNCVIPITFVKRNWWKNVRVRHCWYVLS